MIIASPTVRSGTTVYIRDVRTNSFQIRAYFWDITQQESVGDVTEDVKVMIVEEGTHVLYDGTKIIAGKTKISLSSGYKTIYYYDSEGFTSGNIILTQLTSY